jgi:capsular exopolysaccharide synthesis family protein
MLTTEAELVNAVRSHIGMLDANIVAIDQMRERNKPAAASAPLAEEERLKQQVASLRRSADLLREELQEARIAAAAEVGQVEIVDKAPLPSSPIGIGGPRKIALGFLLGAFLGTLAAFGVEFATQLNTRVSRRGDLESGLDVAALAVVPSINGIRKNGRLRLPRLITIRHSNNGHNGRQSPPLVTIANVQSAPAEAYRLLRTNLLYSQAVSPLKTLVVTSSTPQEGKTTTASNLAVAFAQQGLRVLLVDCDLRRPVVHDVFQLKRAPGLTHVLLKDQSMEEAVREGPVKTLSILPAGSHPPNPSELLGSERMAHFLKAAAADYDLTLLDSPPVLAAPDSAILSASADGVLLVVRAGRTDVQEARDAIAQLTAVGARIVGAVLNDPDSKAPRHETAYYGYYATHN